MHDRQGLGQLPIKESIFLPTKACCQCNFAMHAIAFAYFFNITMPHILAHRSRHVKQYQGGSTSANAVLRCSKQVNPEVISLSIVEAEAWADILCELAPSAVAQEWGWHKIHMPGQKWMTIRPVSREMDVTWAARQVLIGWCQLTQPHVWLWCISTSMVCGGHVAPGPVGSLSGVWG